MGNVDFGNFINRKYKTKLCIVVYYLRAVSFSIASGYVGNEKIVKRQVSSNRLVVIYEGNFYGSTFTMLR